MGGVEAGGGWSRAEQEEGGARETRGSSEVGAAQRLRHGDAEATLGALLRRSSEPPQIECR